jgi:phosphoglycerate dehydrogenase-like enzyme
VINTARGGIVDQPALEAEVMSGRLRAGLDVLEPDELPAGHPLRDCPDALLTAHSVGSNAGHLRPPPLAVFEQYALDNIRRFAAGEPLRFVMDLERYRRST